MAESIITVEKLGKRYRLGARASHERYTALRDVVAEAAMKPFRAMRANVGKWTSANGSASGSASSSPSNVPTFKPSHLTPEDFWALKDVSFEVKQGEVLGIIGRNGAGKSTLLKILSRITEPTEGRIKIRGRVASLLEVGTGFHPELTGRENIFLNGAILGMHRHEIKAKFDEIVAFAEVEKFLDTPVKRFSSGMYVRLAFAVAAHLEPEILIIDEVLAVGDAEFQRKCLGKMHNVAREGGRTVLFVSHNMAVIRSLCRETILLASGKIAYIGQTHIAAQRYVQSDLAALTTMEPRQHDPSGKPRILSAEIQSAVSAANTNVRIRTTIGSSPGVKFGIEIRVNDSQGAPVGFASVGLLDSDSLVHLNSCQESWILALLVPRLARGMYALRLQLTVPMVEVLDVFPDEITFEVDPAPLAKNGRVFEGQWGYGAVEIPLVIQRS